MIVVNVAVRPTRLAFGVDDHCRGCEPSPMNAFPDLHGDLRRNDNGARVLVFEDVELPIRIGVYAHEKGAPQRVSISIELLVVPTNAEHGDRIDQVVDYDRIHGAVLGLADHPHVELQETLADEVVRICFEHPEVAAARVYVRKLDVYADCKSVGIRIVRTRAS